MSVDHEDFHQILVDEDSHANPFISVRVSDSEGRFSIADAKPTLFGQEEHGQTRASLIREKL